ncbi:MAG: N-acetylglucosaminyldiphosphoundecaprenol N-acetyl-beta-D-mannosaminyltransferase [Chroococcidiopsis cubana SAG 39.79]|jgi:N-acetylglucosaminyldiphosphoundecaprenol N-acetyl-beta-D-mannosaminyltransferase|uniref:Acetyl-mannosamine transferase n=1 Tax=Chroococcidiopsis cubana SAG 39.79 TaxID=388085 RepID=A0AB37UCI7_9CYAN|nr:WecB/TagA/CpsF family glycosyltransferase [Chroococcidiopsis cubana]MBE9016207.1 WecB/TagA/CpsF family glycosyltransferase [Chroococcidiopsidales cyanobacterium LEGE 13417]MDZ4872303.1 N-acetylglucosaminyldiphosphoundecaprenol N-acetyl-beta-D-mannosaminyltransferase [Chroococcidiopsis cubana SAG 39.79]PSB63334.1 glycosyltransferase [Chroococcidiopsis cubana CCALA 043]RUT04867.1 acetyl-mannosamine transferase [Chroococcidiopsis cubana SAG 39.79]
MRKVNLLNLDFDNLSIKELLRQLKSGVVFTPNVDHLMKLQCDREFLRAYEIADYKLCDSQILVYASRFLGTPIKEKISGSDFFPAFCTYHRNNEKIKIFLLGGQKETAAKAQEKLNKKIGRNIVVAAHSPSLGFDRNELECAEIVEMINRSGATVLAIGVGAPKQEKWIYQYRNKLPKIDFFLAVGATIDFEAGNVKRAPKWMSEVGFEWLYRLLLEPHRLWKRYLVEDLPFFWLIIKQKFNMYTIPHREKRVYKSGN